MNDPYSVLGVSQRASDADVKKAYRELARKYHPDNYQNNPLADLAEEKMKEINEAYESITKSRSGGGSGYTSGYQQSGGYQPGASAGGNATYSRIRTLIGAGNLVEAERMLMEISVKNGEWYFLSGAIAYRKGWLDEAMQNYNIACQKDPNNMEYRQALMMVQRGGNAYRPQGYQTAGMGNLDCCTTLLCLNCLCGGGGC